MFKESPEGQTHSGCPECGCLSTIAHYAGCSKLGEILKSPKTLTPAEQIRETWEEMKKLDRLRKGKFSIEEYENEDRDRLEIKYANIETLFGHISTETKAIIYYLNSK